MISDMAVMTLPNEDRLRECMGAGYTDPSIAASMYYAIKKNAGEERVGPGIVLMLMLALNDVVKDYPPGMFSLLKDSVLDWALAIADGNEAVQADIRTHWKLLTTK